MSTMIDRLARLKASSEKKSYIIGLERGRIWAMEHADYLDVRRWSELEVEDAWSLILPDNEETHYHLIRAETRLEWIPYVKGWLEGVREAFKAYK